MRGDADLSDPAFLVEREGGEYLRRLQENDPVHRHTPPGREDGFWVVTRFEDARRVLADRAHFRSGRGNMLDSLLAGGDPAGGRLLALTDSVEHGALRSLLRPMVDPSRVPGLADVVERKATELVLDAVSRGDCDFGSTVSDVLPAAVICSLLGVPPADIERLLSLTHESLGSVRADQRPGEAWSARLEILRYFRWLLHHGTSEGMLAALCGANPKGRRLSEDEIILNCYGLLLAGDETTRLCLNTAVVTFARHPDLWHSFAGAALPGAVDELLRWVSPARHVARTVGADVELDGRRLREGEIVTVWIATANRDPRRWHDPDELDWSRDAGAHLGLGFGAHYCLGAALARLQIAAVLSRLRTFCGALEPSGEPAPIYSTFLNGFATAPVRLVRR
jgi:cytochrome P450